MTSINLTNHWFDSTGVQTHDLPHARPVLYLFGHCIQSKRIYNMWCIYIIIKCNRHGGRIVRTRPYRTKGPEFHSKQSQNNDLHNWYLSLPGLALDTSRIGQGLVSECQYVSEGDIRSWCLWFDFPVGQPYEVTVCAHYPNIRSDMTLDVARRNNSNKQPTKIHIIYI